MSSNYRRTAGPGHDLEVFSYERRAFVTLPNAFPLSGQQGMQILDFQNRHTEAPKFPKWLGTTALILFLLNDS